MNIERFAIHDGDGIRTTVFLLGCPLHCPWCCNPESQLPHPQLLWNEKKCLHCGTCVTICPNGAVGFESGIPVFDRKKCKECHTCEKNCPGDAIHFSGKWMSSDEIMQIILKDKDYYDNSHGGVTFSGGEAFLQFKGLMALLQSSRDQHLNTAVETAGNIPTEQILAAEPYVDTFLFDMKHIDPEKFHRVTGGNLDLICANLQKLASVRADKIRLRVPVIPEFNFDSDTILGIMKFAEKNGIRRVDLLPYHSLGKNKYAQLSRNYPMGETAMLKKEDLQLYMKAGKSLNLDVTIGG